MLLGGVCLAAGAWFGMHERSRGPDVVGDVRPAARAAGLERQMRAGDLLFRRGNGMWSELFAQTSPRNGFFSHVGLIVADGDGWIVLHNEADDTTGIGGVRADTVDHFLDGAKGVALVRLALPAGTAARVAALADTPTWRGIPFDSQFTLDDGGRAMYCTEWAWAVIKRATQVDLAPVKSVVAGRTAVTIDDLLYSPGTTIVLERRVRF